MQEGDLRDQSSTDEEGNDFVEKESSVYFSFFEGGHSNSGGRSGSVDQNVDFRIEGQEESSADVSDPNVKELVLFLNKQIDTALSSTESDEDSFNPNNNVAGGGGKGSSEDAPPSSASWERSGSDKRSADASTLVAQMRTKPTDPKVEIKKLNDKVKLLISDRKIQREVIESQKAEIATLRSATSAAVDDSKMQEYEARQARNVEELATLQKRMDVVVQESDFYKAEAAKSKAEAARNKELLDKYVADEGAKSTVTPVVLESATRDLDTQTKLSELENESKLNRKKLDEAEGAVEEKDKTIRDLEAKVEGLLRQNDMQSITIESQNAKIAKLTDNSFSFSSDKSVTNVPSESVMRQQQGDTTFERDFAALDAALENINESVTKSSPLTPEQQQVQDLRLKVAERDNEIASLSSTVKKLEALAFERSAGSTSSADQDNVLVRELQERNEELREKNEKQAQTLAMQKSTIASLREENDLLGRKANDQDNDNQINVNKQRQTAQNLKADQQKIQEAADKLARDKEEFAKHLVAFKEMRRGVFKGALIQVGGGVSKSRYRTLRQKHDKYKRKDYRKGKDINAMQKRLLQNVELLEVEDSHSSSEEGRISEGVSASTTSQLSSRHKSVQIVADSGSASGSEADSEEK